MTRDAPSMSANASCTVQICWVQCWHHSMLPSGSHLPAAAAIKSGDVHEPKSALFSRPSRQGWAPTRQHRLLHGSIRRQARTIWHQGRSGSAVSVV